MEVTPYRSEEDENLSGITPEVRALIAKIAAGKKVTVEGKWLVGEGVEAETARPYNMIDLANLRLLLRNTAKEYPSGSANSRTLRRLVESVDDTTEALAKASGDETLIAEHRKVRELFRQKAGAFEDPAVEAIKDGRLGDVWAILSKPEALGERSSLHAVKTALGDKWEAFSRDSLNRRLADSMDSEGRRDSSTLLKELSGLPEDLRFALYGVHGEEVLQSLTDIATSSRQADEATESLSKADLTYTAKVAELEQERDRQIRALEAERDEQIFRIDEEAAAKRQVVQDSVAYIVGDGDINKILHDSARFSKFIGTLYPGSIKSLARMTLESWVYEASTVMRGGKIVKGVVRPEEVLNKFNAFRTRPAIINAFFHVDAEAAAYCTKVISDMEDIVCVRKATKYLILVAITITAGGIADYIFGPMQGFLSMLAVLGAELGFETVTRIANYLADHLTFWRLIGLVGRIAAVFTWPVRFMIKRR